MNKNRMQERLMNEGGVIMAVPKRKTSKARRDSRRANWKLSIPGIVECPQCHQTKLAHRVCKKCGYYDGKQVVNIDSDNKKAKS